MTQTITHASSTPPAPAPTSTVVARPPGWWQRNWKWAIPTGAVVLAGGFVGFIVLLAVLIFGAIKNTDVYETAVYEAKTTPAVIAALGVPIDEGLFVMGNIQISPGSGYADMAIPIEGPSGKATVFVEAERIGGEWLYSTLSVAIHDSSEDIDLLVD